MSRGHYAEGTTFQIGHIRMANTDVFRLVFPLASLQRRRLAFERLVDSVYAIDGAERGRFDADLFAGETRVGRCRPHRLTRIAPPAAEGIRSDRGVECPPAGPALVGIDRSTSTTPPTASRAHASAGIPIVEHPAICGASRASLHACPSIGRGFRPPTPWSVDRETSPSRSRGGAKHPCTLCDRGCPLWPYAEALAGPGPGSEAHSPRPGDRPPSSPFVDRRRPAMSHPTTRRG
jgi:hypothetical protein